MRRLLGTLVLLAALWASPASAAITAAGDVAGLRATAQPRASVLVGAVARCEGVDGGGKSG